VAVLAEEVGGGANENKNLILVWAGATWAAVKVATALRGAGRAHQDRPVPTGVRHLHGRQATSQLLK
jgi:hypothetical protein